ncbi:GATA type transcriptional activator of nitrogen-regulated proteins [Coemansia erecta]|uniref:GATA type transcriptional activator of nitrogen-regulated proteins n=1 Tax=Coemansia erecta TaxID=147472 RepID=A0A9W7Y6C0_9FUNG|nr:GATA type transcriptional activator of nitrogen-regulated proteins [Coemansia erecta]
MSQNIPSFAALTKSLAVASASTYPDVRSEAGSSSSSSNRNATMPIDIQSPERLLASRQTSPTSVSTSPKIKVPREPRVGSQTTNSSSSGSGAVCYNCGVDTTPLWRRDADGNVICNACGLYYKLHNVTRPLSMKRNTIKRRRRRATNSGNSTGTSTPSKPMIKLPASADAAIGRCSSLPLGNNEDAQIQQLSTSAQDSSLSMRVHAAFQVAADKHQRYQNGSNMHSNLSSTLSSTRSSVSSTPWGPMSFSPTSSIPTTPYYLSHPSRGPSEHSGMRDNRLAPVTNSQMFGLESLMKAAELSPTLPSIEHESERMSPYYKKRSYAPQQLPHESLLDSLATVATAEISLSTKRQAIRSTANNSVIVSSSDGADGMSSRPAQRSAYRDELERECERLQMESSLRPGRAVMSISNISRPTSAGSR